MKKTKFGRFFETLIYFILLTIPLISVFARTIYVQSNPNAKDSYSTQYVRSSTLMGSNAQLSQGLTYYLNFNGNVGNVRTASSRIFYSSISIDWTDYGVSSSLDVKGFMTYKNDAGTSNLYLFDASNTQVAVLWDYFGTRIMDFSFTVSTTVSLNGNQGWDLYYFLLETSTLDNAFDYGLQKTLDDFGTGNINFTNWFSTLFFNVSNLLYIQFVNMYLNYALWVSVSYLLYYFLNWFIRFVRETLDNLIYKETKN